MSKKQQVIILQLDTNSPDSLKGVNKKIEYLGKEYENVTVHFDKCKTVGSFLIIPVVCDLITKLEAIHLD